MSTPSRFRKLATMLAIGATLCNALPAGAGQLNIATDPLGTGTSSIKPNIMFILDDSGSMASNYMPDYVNDSHNPTSTTAACFDSGDDSSGNGAITGTPDACVFGDPPFNSPDFNTIYYNPTLRYRPGVNADGTDMPNQDNATTSAWTQVRTDPYQSASTTNIVTGYQDRVWCTAFGDTAGGGNCRQNSAYTFPNASFPFGLTSSGGSVKYLTGSPYYYRMQSAQWCTSAARTNCVSGTSVNPAVHTFQAPEFCSDAELTTCQATLPIPATHTFSGVRWCDNNTTMTNCQRKKIGAFIHAKHLGSTVAGTVPAQAAEGNIQVTSVLAGGGSINALTVGATPVIAAPIPIAAGSSPTGVAAQIVTAINTGPAAATYVASQSGTNVVVTATATGTAANGQAIALTPSSTGTTAARGRLTVSTASVNDTITSLTVNGQQLLTCAPATGTPPQTSPVSFTTSGNTAQWQAGGGTSGAQSRIIVTAGTSSNNRRTAARNALVAAINACGSVTPPYSTTGWTATTNGSYAIDIIAPVSLGASPNGAALVETGSMSTSLCNMGNTACGGVLGASTFATTATTVSLSGGAVAFTGVVRIGVGAFQRTDIVPSVGSYVKSANRTDCAGASCTYDEEMTNFANWYAYARTRMHMMKGAVGRAFSAVSSAYRVGFITICPGGGGSCGNTTTGTMGINVDPNKYLKIADFDTTHRNNWYTKVYNTDPSNNTPLREALSRVGLIFAGQFGSGLTGGLSVAAGDDPIIASCQPNFAILSTDGYWNGGPGRQIDNSTLMGNQDNTNTAPYSLQSDGVFDGGTPVASNTLADVALHYYKTDLRPAMPATVPTTNKDTNGEQHMVTFTIGLGLDGQLSYRPDYETAPSGDFFNIKQGSIKWPVPVADSPTALDDLWHAAVNGRGVFYSAKSPDAVSQGLGDTLEQLQTRVGAGAAAATSNLQPVAGDNFAFTAQYQTNDWIGDLKARTIDLASGIVSSVQLWSAAEQLDAGTHTSRRIYTFDNADSAGNRLKHFCMPADVGAAWCNDGTGLTAAEQAFFDPAIIALAQESSWTTAGSTTSLVNYIRGDEAFYNTVTAPTPRTATDLYRNRISTLGDIVNAQPSYVKKTPFSYIDTGYAEFKACTEGTGSSCPAAQFPNPSLPRRGTVFAAANDGMLHAFETDVNDSPYYQTAGIATAVTSDDVFVGNNAGNGAERWAYIPGLVLPSVAVLAEEPYVHRYFVDGSPTVGDICTSTPCAGVNDWRTLLVAGLNAGGRGYYALDITNPAAATTGVKALWEFGYTAACVPVGAQGIPVGGPFYGDCHVGLSYGAPIITKRTSDGKWVVIVTSGYNNGSANGNGNGLGYVYILDAVTGAILHRLSTPVGSGTAASPNGLAKVAAWTTSGSTNNLALAVYGGDLNGRLWRFDLDYNGGVNTNFMGVTQVAQVVDAANIPQPITVKPELGDYNGKRLILFGTGKFLEGTDKTPPFTTQTIYALRDEPSVITSPVISNVRDTSVVIQRSFAAGSLPGTRTVAAGTAPNWSTEFGWLIDLPDSGERVNVDPVLQLGTLVVASNVPTTDTCTAGGISYLNFLDYATGSYVPGATGNLASVNIGSSLTVGINVVQLPGGKVVTIATTAANQQLTQDTPVVQGKYQGRRVSWRELIVE